MSTILNRAAPPRGQSPAAPAGRKTRRRFSNRLPVGHWKAGWLCLSGLAAGLSNATAQDVLSSPPLIPATPAAVQERQNNNPMQVFAPEAVPPTLFQWGPVTLHPHADYQFLYGTGIQSSPGKQQDTTVQRISPGALFDLGTHWTLDYTPTFSIYSGGDFRNTVNHSARLGWGTAYENWFFSGSQSYVYNADPNVQTASQSDRQTYATALNASYQFNDKMSLDLGANQSLNYVGNTISSTNYQQNLVNSRNWSTMDWLMEQFWPRFSAGLGAGFGYNQQDNSPDSVYEQYQGRINWRATDKISFQVDGGLHDQQYLSGNAGNLATPIYDGTIQYQPFDHTMLSVTASRVVSTSYYQDQTTENTSVLGNLNQRLFGKLTLDLSGGYNQTKYVASFYGLSTGRNDDYYSFNARLSCPFLKRGTVAVLYNYRENSSNQTGFAASGSSAYGFSSNQVGFELGYRY